jgi:hypothetical protein
MEPGELPGSAREHAPGCSINVGQIHGAMPVGDIVARARQIEADVRVEDALIAGRFGIDDPRAWLDLLQG